MNNGEREFNEMLAWMESEILALKTAHQRPLGALDFFEQTTTLDLVLNDTGYGSYTKTFWLDVTIQMPDVKPPIVQVGWDLPAGFSYVDFYESTTTDDYDVWSYKLSLTSPTIVNVPFKVSALSSLPIISITARNI